MKKESCKDTTGKLRVSLVEPTFIEWIAKVREYGCNKYGGRDTWKSVDKSDYIDATLRHLLNYMKGEQEDKESGLHHLAHAACNIMFLLSKDGDNNE